MVLLHSDAIGEIQQSQWELIVKSRQPGGSTDFDYEHTRPPLGSHSDSEFNNPK